MRQADVERGSGHHRCHSGSGGEPVVPVLPAIPLSMNANGAHLLPVIEKSSGQRHQPEVVKELAPCQGHGADELTNAFPASLENQLHDSCSAYPSSGGSNAEEGQVQDPGNAQEESGQKASVTRPHQMPNARGILEEVAAAYPSTSRPFPDADPLRLLPFEVSAARIRTVHRPNAMEVSERLEEVNTVKTNGIYAHQVLESVDPDFKSNFKSHIAVTLTRSQKRNARTNQHHRSKA